MSREIAFRAWDKRRRKYAYCISKYGARKWFVLARGVLRFDWYDNFILEQDTGVKDKNGKRIYEGDIVQIPGDWEEYGMAAGQRYEVYFAYGGFRCKPWGLAKRRGDRGYWIEDSEDFEVVGNVHENPELVGGEE